MSFVVVGKGSFTKNALINFLESVGVSDPQSVVKEAEKGRVLCGNYRILANI
jgi:hypothetical protein